VRDRVREKEREGWLKTKKKSERERVCRYIKKKISEKEGK
jgi:hypothetical protein